MRPIPIWLRALFLVTVVLLLPQGLGLVAPAQVPFPVTVTPLNARFIGALYLAAAVGMVLSALGRDVADARIFLIGFGIISALVLVVTLLYWGDFSERRVPVVWLATYVVDPIAVAASLLALRPLVPEEPGAHPFSGLLRAAAVLLGATGLVLLLAPGAAALVWPWRITALLSQVYGAFLLTFGVGAWLAAGERRGRSILPVVASTATLFLLAGLASSFHLDRFTPGLASAVWFGALAVGFVAFGLALVWLLLLVGLPALRPEGTVVHSPGCPAQADV
jgi:hypothetical protein